MTVGEALADAAQGLRAAGIEQPRREARLILAEASGISQATLAGWPERAVDAEAARRFAGLIARRAAREPLSRVLGRREFWSLPFLVTADTLDPRPDSETVVEAALTHIPDRNAQLRLLDLGTGTGCLLLALLHELPQAVGLGTERSEAAARVAAANAGALGLASRARVAVGDWGDAVGTASIDLAVANPPYIPADEIAALAPEVRLHDPRAALDGGTDGLDAYRALAPALARVLVAGGLAVLEVGRGQAGVVTSLLAGAGLEPVETRADLAGIPRAVVMRNGPEQK